MARRLGQIMLCHTNTQTHYTTAIAIAIANVCMHKVFLCKFFLSERKFMWPIHSTNTRAAE